MNEIQDKTLTRVQIEYIYQLWKKEDSMLRSALTPDHLMAPTMYSMHVGFEAAYRNILQMLGINPDNIASEGKIV